MNALTSYPKALHLGHGGLEGMFAAPVYVEEKVDGSQFSFGVFGGELKIKSKNKLQVLDAPDKMFEEGVAAIRALHESAGLTPEWAYTGEYLRKPKHNTLAYDRVPDHHVILFDIRTGDERYLCRDEIEDEAARLDLEVVPLLAKGVFERAADLEPMLETPSVLGGQTVEGIVVKQVEVKLFDRRGKALMGKYVGPEFRELNKREFRKANPLAGDIVQSLIEEHKTHARWAKAVQHLRDRGELTHSPKDIGALIKEIQGDTRDECADGIKDALFKWAWPKIQRGIISGLPDWYKQRLLRGEDQ